jgi:[acyl-carrier-protein] S-malonyltransferase
MARTAFLFPGQGAQAVGMARDLCAALPRARERFTSASRLLGYDLLDLCVQGPAERLGATDVSQPAIFVASLAALDLLREQEPEVEGQCVACAGLSLGEYTALVFAGALEFEEGLQVVRKRGEAMQAASVANPGAMLSVIGMDRKQLEQHCQAIRGEETLELANLLCPGNMVVSGSKSCCAALEERIKEAGGRTVPLAVAGAFHTVLMKPADQALAEALDGVRLGSPRVPVWSNVDARPHTDPAEIRALLIRQVLQPVLWEDTLRGLLSDGCDRFYEIGPGRVLSGLLKRVQRQVDCRNISA